MSAVRRAIGFGCTSGASADDVVALVRTVLAGEALGPETVLATLDRRAATGFRVAAALGVELVTFTADELRRVRGTRRASVAAQNALGLPSVAEAAALAALGVGAKLATARLTGRRCTCAVAERDA